jgi:alcohol dehydrogenase (NADP+)
MKYLPVAEGHKIPALGLGTWKSNKGEVAAAVSEAIKIGYRHIDCAPIYMNEQEVGSALGTALTSGQVKREELWITSKLWNNAHAKKQVRPALEKTLRDLRIDYLDLFLIHWPVHFQPNVMFPRCPEEFLAPDAIPLGETWQAMESLVEKGLCRYIGVCNFHLGRLQQLKKEASIQPLLNQIESHPYLQQVEMLKYCKTNGTLFTAYSPLGSGDRPVGMKKSDEPSLLQHPTVVAIAEKNSLTPGQVLLAWALARGTIVIPKSINPGRLRENFQAADLILAPVDLAAITALESGYRYVDGTFFTSSGSPYTVTDLWG